MQRLLFLEMWLKIQMYQKMLTLLTLLLPIFCFLIWIFSSSSFSLLVIIYTHLFPYSHCLWIILTISSTQLMPPAPPMSPMWPNGRVGLWVRLFPGVQSLHRTRRPRLERRERCSVPGAMDYQQKLAEKFTILNERGNGVLIRMNYIKKVREIGSFVEASGACNRREIRNLTFVSDTLPC